MEDRISRERRLEEALKACKEAGNVVMAANILVALEELRRAYRKTR